MVEMRVREQDSFDVQALQAWLDTVVPGLGAIEVVEQFAGGASNLTFRIGCEHRDVVLRTSPAGRKAASAHDMQREARLLQAIRPQFREVPEVLAVTDDYSPLGRPAFVSEYVDGLILRRDLPEGADAGALADLFVSNLVRLHAINTDSEDLKAFHKGDGYVRRQVEGWSRRYRQARTEDVPSGDGVMRWLDAVQPPDCGVCVIHNDWRFDNLVLDPTGMDSVLAVLDWELATVGDPFMDLGSAMAYWIQSDDDEQMQAFRMQPSNAPGMPTREQIVQRYCELSGRKAPDWSFYEVFGLFRLAVIAQQIWYRYSAGQTDNPAFAPFGVVVNNLMDRCEQLVRSH